MNRTLGGSTDLLLRNLDCAVIETLHQLRSDEDEPAFDSARDVFVEGNPLYPGGRDSKGKPHPALRPQPGVRQGVLPAARSRLT